MKKNIRIRHTAIEHIFYAAFRESGVYSYERRHSGGPSELGQRCKMYYHARRPPPDRTGHAATAAYSAVNAPVYRQHGCSSVATSGVGRGIGFGAGCSVSFSTGSSVGCIIVFGVGSSVGRTIAFGAGSIASCSAGYRIGFGPDCSVGFSTGSTCRLYLSSGTRLQRQFQQWQQFQLHHQLRCWLQRRLQHWQHMSAVSPSSIRLRCRKTSLNAGPSSGADVACGAGCVIGCNIGMSVAVPGSTQNPAQLVMTARSSVPMPAA